MCQYGTCCLSKPPPLWPQATFHRPRVGSAGEEALGTQRWGILHYIPDMEIKIKSVSMVHAVYQSLHPCGHRQPSIDPGSGQWVRKHWAHKGGAYYATYLTWK